MPPIATVLIVEDEPLVRMDIVEQLDRLGFRTLEAENAREAMALLSAGNDIGLIFTDIDMPGTMDGLMLAAAVRDRWPPIHIIITSGHRKVSRTDLPENSRFIAKPYSGDAVAHAMQEMLA